MTERDAFVQVCLASPDDSGPRLAFADWLEERGEVLAAEWVRVAEQRFRNPSDPGQKLEIQYWSLVSRLDSLPLPTLSRTGTAGPYQDGGLRGITVENTGRCPTVIRILFDPLEPRRVVSEDAISPHQHFRHGPLDAWGGKFHIEQAPPYSAVSVYGRSPVAELLGS